MRFPVRAAGTDAIRKSIRWTCSQTTGIALRAGATAQVDRYCASVEMLQSVHVQSAVDGKIGAGGESLLMMRPQRRAIMPSMTCLVTLNMLFCISFGADAPALHATRKRQPCQGQMKARQIKDEEMPAPLK